MCKTMLAVHPLLFAVLVVLTTGAVAQPKITSFSPDRGPVGTTVTITGSGFNVSPAANIVYFGAVRAAVTASSANSLTVTVPAGATYQPVSVLNNTNGLTGYADKPYLLTFNNPFGSGIPVNFYQPKKDFQTDAAISPIVLSDIDGDGKPDIVGARGYVSVLRNTSVTGSKTAVSYAAAVKISVGMISISSLAVDDLDGDGKPDIVMTDIAFNKVYVLRNTSTTGSITEASFAPPVVFSTESFPQSAVIGDVNGDGRPDIIYANYISGSVSILTNSSVPGTINASSFANKFDYPVADAPVCLALRDLDGDSKPDLVVTYRSTYKTISFLRNTSTPGNLAPSFAAAVNIQLNYSVPYFTIADMDGDGKPDILTVDYGGNFNYTGISVLRNTAVPGIISPASFATDVLISPQSATDFTIGDADGDGKPDIIAKSSGKPLLFCFPQYLYSRQPQCVFLCSKS